jgi:hypothetical protein
MAISINDAHQFIRQILKKNKGGFVAPVEIDRAINRGVSDWISAVISKYHKTGKFEYDHLLVKRANFTVSSSTGVQSISAQAADYIEGLTVYLTVSGGTPVEGTIYSWDEFLEVQNSKIVAPDESYPAATIYIVNESGVDVPKIQFSPVPTSGNYTYTLVYMRKPANAVYNYNFNSSTGNFTFNETGSVNIDISDRYYTDIITRALMYLGISLRDGDIVGTEALMDRNQKEDELKV